MRGMASSCCETLAAALVLCLRESGKEILFRGILRLLEQGV